MNNARIIFLDGRNLYFEVVIDMKIFDGEVFLYCHDCDYTFQQKEILEISVF